MPAANRWIVLSAVMLAYLLIIVDMTILHVATPSLTLALGASGNEVLWVIDIYALTMAGLLLPMGTLADRLGYRKIILIGLIIFGVASLGAALSTSAAMLIGFRALLGVGASMIMPSVLAIIRTVFEDEAERAQALGIWSVVGMAGAAIGPLAGGLLLEHFWWGSVFLINLPILAVVLPMTWFLVPKDAGRQSGEWQIGQAALLVVSIILSVYGIKAGVKDGWTVVSAGAVVCGLGSLFMFGQKQLRTPSPLLDVTLFQKPVISVGILMAFIASGALIGFELVLSQELQYVMGLSPLSAGMFMMPLVIAAAVGGPLGGAIVQRAGLRWTASLSMLGAAASLAGLAYVDLATQGIATAALLAGLGLGLGIGLLASSIAIMGSAPAEKAGAAGALEGMGYELGAGMGVTFFGLLVNSIYSSAFVLSATVESDVAGSIGEAMTAAQQIGGQQGEMLKEAAREAFTHAHGTVLLVTAGMIGALAVVVNAALRNSSGPPTH